MSFLAKALQSATGGSSPAQADVLKPELLGSIRVAVVGEPYVGKTALTELIASGLPARGSTRSTAGCHVHVKLVDNLVSPAGGRSPRGSSGAGQQQLQPHDSISSTTGGGGGALGFMASAAEKLGAAVAGGGGGGPSQLPAQRKFFVELWDVSGQPKYAQLRSVFYKQLNGVILVYDVTNKASLARLQAWAAEVAHEGSFVAPLGDDLAARNVGGLPVPVLVVGNKSDRVGFASGSSSSHPGGGAVALSSFLNGVCAQALLGPPACSGWWPRRALYRVTGLGAPNRPPSESSMAAAAAEAGLEPHLLGLTTSAAAGEIDWDKVNGFLRALWERRYQPATAGAAAAAAAAAGAPGGGWRLPPPGGFGGGGMGGGVGLFSEHPGLLLPPGAAGIGIGVGAPAGIGAGAALDDDDRDARLDDNDWV